MAELEPGPALAGLDLPATLAGVTLAAAPDRPVAAVLPFRGAAAELAGALGAELPPPGRTARLADGSELAWAGLDQWLARGPVAGPGLAETLAGRAAVVDQSDGWAAVTLTGAAAPDVLARLAPVDLAPAAFPSGSAARTELRHVPCLILARDGGVEILVPRSYAVAAMRELTHAMRAVAARAAIAREAR